jgi:two-component system nitrate/nitrite response regulator NarL
MAEPIRVLVVDQPTMSRRGVTALLGRRRGLRVVGEAGCAADALAQARTLQPDVAVVETDMPGGGTLLAALRKDVPTCAVLVLTCAAADGAARALHAGARAFLQKNCEPGDLTHAIHRIHRGEVVVGAGAAPLLKGLGQDQASSGLTGRELEVLPLVAVGRTNLEIAHALGITEHTAKEHLANILDKLGLANRVQVAAYAFRHGLALAEA